MHIDEIRDPELKKLFKELGPASATIENDGNDALEESGNDDELINNWQSKLMGLYNECQSFWGALEQMKGRGGIAVKEVQTLPPILPATPHTLPVSLPGAIRRYLSARGIWQVTGVQFRLNDEYSRQVRRDSLAFTIDERYRTGQ